MKPESLYKIEDGTSVNGSQRVFRAVIDPQSEIFKGHFPGAPVLPGVCTLSIVKDCLEKVVSQKSTICEISQCKFTGMVDPLQEQIMNIEIEVSPAGEERGKISANVKMSESGRVIMKFRGGYRIG